MNKLWAFGDSYTAGILPDLGHFPPYIKYMKYLGISKEEFPEGWAYQLAEKLNMNYENFGVGGSSNNETFIKIAKNSHRFQKDDIVIINWTYLHRFLWALPNEDWADNETGDEGIPFFKFRRASINIHIDENILNDKTNLSNVYEYVGLNKSLDAWIEEILSWENIIDSLSKSVGFHVYYWSAEHRIHTILGKEFSNKKYICNDIVSNYLNTKLKEGMPHEHIPSELFHISLKQYGAKTIFEETNGEVEDDHHFGIIGNKIQSELFYDWIKKTK
jgi:hypothetical protein